MNEEKVKFTVEKIEDAGNKKGSPLLKVFIRSNGMLYKKVVKKSSYLDKYTRKGIHELWAKELKEIVVTATENEGDRKKEDKALAALVGTEVESEDIEE